MQFKEAAFLLDEMVFKGFVPHPASIFKLVDRLSKEKNVELLCSILNGACKGNAVDADLWRKAITMVFNDNKISSVCELVDSLVVPVN
uniref:Pentatricopeptide repeat-containing protein n=1 Tax=Rhizophora mucronata TaxID=61149 RepID=A0A2P2J200_RHIMU